MDSSSLTSRLRWADFIRALGAFLVVMAHVEYHGAGSTLARDFYYALTRAAVPIFFMASGYLLLARSEALVDFFRKRALKVFLPFLAWSVIYLVWKGEALDKSFFEIVKIYTLKIIRGPRENHLWFFYELFGLYLFTPVLRVYLQNARRGDLLYFLSAWLLLIPAARTLLEFTPLQIGFTYYFLGGYVGYFLFGHFARGVEISRRAAWGFFLLGWALTLLGMTLSRAQGWKTQYFEDYLSLNVILMAAGLFLALKDIKISDSLQRWASPLSRASFGIYLAHVLVMTELFRLPFFAPLLEAGLNVWMIPLLGALGFALTSLLIFTLQRIPLLRWLVP